MKRVYLSHAPAAAQRADELRRILLAQGYQPWIDPEPPEGQLWQHAMDGAIQQADALILLVTSETADSIYITYECAYALGRGIPVFAIIADDAQLHPRLLQTPRFDMRDFADENRFWDHFVAALRQQLEPAASSPATARLPAYVPPPEIDRSIVPESPGDWIVTRRGPIRNAMFRLERDATSLGRDGANNIVIANLQVSRFHLRILREGDNHRLEDLGSANGTRVNGILLHAPILLEARALISLGDAVVLTYERIAAS